MLKNLRISEKSSTFAPAFKKRLLNGVMVALQILVLSVWVRVLVEQHRRDLMGLFLVVIPTQTQVLSPKGARLLLRNLRVLVEQPRGVKKGDRQ